MWNCLAGLGVTVQWPVLRYLRLMTAQFTGSHADAASKRGRSSASHTSFTPSRSLSSSPPPPHLALTSPPLLATLPPLPSSTPLPPNPTNGLPHCGRNVTTLICVAGRKEGMFNGFFSFYLLREPCYVLMDSAAAAWPSTLPLPHPKVEHQGRTAGHYLRQTSVTPPESFFYGIREASHPLLRLFELPRWGGHRKLCVMHSQADGPLLGWERRALLH